MMGEYLMFFQNDTRSKFTIPQNQTYSFTSLINQKFSESAVILGITVFERCTQELPVVKTQGSSNRFLFS